MCSSNNTEELALTAELREEMGKALVHAKSVSSHSSLCHRDDKRWLEIAGSLVQGKSKTSLRKDKGGKYDYSVIENVIAELEDYGGLDSIKGKFAVRAVRSLNMLDDLTAKVSEKLLQSLEDGDYEASPKDLKELAIASQIHNGIYLRSKNEATHIIEERKVTVEDYEAKKNRLLEEMKRAQDVIDVD